MINGKKVVKNKSALFALTEAKVHYIKVDPNSDEYLKVWIKEPTWLEVEKAMNSLMNIDEPLSISELQSLSEISNVINSYYHIRV